ncbi:MAG: hypothetical protein CFE44_11205 [Burkholderiales bacterium PBB4]|nr:MAG: hypothetical protein CFE44_11205 [Burkholderiales bacterium PBB4]
MNFIAIRKKTAAALQSLIEAGKKLAHTVARRQTLCKTIHQPEADATKQRELFTTASSTFTAVHKPLRIVRILDAGSPHAHVGRMVISGRMADVCAELDRLAAREAIECGISRYATAS